MKFYFCETCGKRLTDADLAEGAGKDKKLKGVFCRECAVGVTTMEAMPLSEEKARQLLLAGEKKEVAAKPTAAGTSKFYFCEKCGERLNERDIEAGKAKDKKLKGVYCRGCSEGVLTMEYEGMTSDEARRIVAQSRKKRGSRGVQVDPLATRRKDRRGSSRLKLQAAGGDQAAQSPTVATGGMGIAIAAGVGGLALVGVVLLLFVGSDSSRSTKRKKARKKRTVAAAKEKDENSPKETEASAKANAPTTTRSAGAYTAPKDDVQASSTGEHAEEAAERAFENLQLALKGLGEDRKARAAKVRQFLDQHGQTIVAARARSLLTKLDQKVAAPAEPAGPTLPPSPTASRGKADREQMDAALSRLRYTRWVSGFLPLLRAKDVARARAELDKATKDRQLTASRAKVEVHRKALSWLETIGKAYTAGLQKLKEVDSFDLRTERGFTWSVGKSGKYKITEVKSDRIEVTQQGASMSVMLKSLAPGSRARIADLGLGSDATALTCKALSVFLSEALTTATDRSPTVAIAIEKARQAGALKEEGDYLLHLVDMREQCLKWAEVEAAWRKVEDFARARQWEPLQAGLSAFDEQFGETDLAKVNREAFDRYWNEAAAKVVPTIGLVGHWPMDEGEGPVVRDMTANAMHGKQDKAEWVEGRIHGALSFAGGPSGVNIRPSPGLDVDRFTLALWFSRTENDGGYLRLMGRKRHYHKGAWGLMLQAGRFLAYVNMAGHAGNILRVRADPPCEPNRWYHGVGTYDGEVLKVYVNGEFKNALRVGGPLPAVKDWLVFAREGMRGPHLFNYEGRIDDVRLYNRALSGVGIATLYKSADRLAAAPPAKPKSPTNPVATKPGPSKGSGEHLTINAEADTYVSTLRKDQAPGKHRFLRASARHGSIALLRFDLSDVKGSVAKAVLRLKLVSALPKPTTQELIYLEGSGWDEEKVTWLSKPALTTHRTTFTVPAKSPRIDIDATRLVQIALGQAKGDGGKLTFAIRAGADPSVVSYASRETGRVCPVLLITPERTGASDTGK